ncbi:hypothetical protein PDJAM_G00133190 [Pangasius djambal]|uniref:Uncharacterized protein n=1 Tax=Pangasius djambal TaxID=1691987 RepID=A0ACC5ZC32_9TELE|nr:hypothetical protein [Pangasius djambal]
MEGVIISETLGVSGWTRLVPDKLSVDNRKNNKYVSVFNVRARRGPLSRSGPVDLWRARAPSQIRYPRPRCVRHGDR